MKNTLTFASIYKSIKSLPTIDLPSFVVLTGRNGSGKTHLLESLNGGLVKSSLAINPDKDILLYDWNTIIPKDTGIFHTHQHLTKQSNWFSQIRSHQDKAFPNIQQTIMKLGIPAEQCSTLPKIRKITHTKVQELIDDETRAGAVYDQIQQALKTHGKQIYTQTQRQISDETWKKMAPLVASERPELFLETSESRFFSDRKFLWGEIDPFQQAFGRLFSTYRDLIHQNDRLEKYPPLEDGDLRYLAPDEFVKLHGEPPWVFVNRILDVCDLDFRVNSPPMHETSSFEPKLTKVTADVEMKFGDLSSGEKVLMSFALCLYNSKDRRQGKQFPKLLLLDEVDAPLHPSMVVSLLNTIQEVLVNDEKVSVVLTTHSPSTVALAPEESLYEMNPNGPLIEKCSKGRALSILTTGVPTLSISFEGRRQVFVESKTDAALYERIYQRYKDVIKSERSLSFIEVGHRSESGGEANAGCAQVQRIVAGLSSAGNESVYGLVDWDCSVSESSRVKVLSPNVRNGLESLLFDPVLLVAACIRENIAFSRQRNIAGIDESYAGIFAWDRTRWQGAVDNIQEILIGPKNAKENAIGIKYLNGMELNIRTDYLHKDDHELETSITSAFGFFNPKNNRAGALMSYVCDTVLTDFPNLLPQDLIDTFIRLLDDQEC